MLQAEDVRFISYNALQEGDQMDPTENATITTQYNRGCLPTNRCTDGNG